MEDFLGISRVEFGNIESLHPVSKKGRMLDYFERLNELQEQAQKQGVLLSVHETPNVPSANLRVSLFIIRFCTSPPYIPRHHELQSLPFAVFSSSVGSLHHEFLEHSASLLLLHNIFLIHCILLLLFYHLQHHLLLLLLFLLRFTASP